MKKHISTVILCLCLSVTAMASSLKVDNMDKPFIKLDGVLQPLMTEPTVVEGYTLVSLYEISRYIEATVSRDGTVYVLTRAGSTLTINSNSKKATLNEKEITLSVAPKFKGETLLVSLRDICEAFKISITQDEKTKQIVISTGTDRLSVLKTNNTSEVISYNEALTKSIASNSTIETLRETVDYLDEAKAKTNDKITGILMFADSSKFVEALRSVSTLEAEISNSQLNETLLKDTSQMLLLSSISTIASAEMDIQLMEETIALETVNLNNLKLKNQLGMASQEEVNASKEKLATYETNLAALRLSLKTGRQSLNKLLQNSPDKEVRVDYIPKVVTISEPMTQFASAKLASSIMTKQMENTVNKEKEKLDSGIHLIDPNDLTNEAYNFDKLERETALNKAVRDLESTKTDMKNDIYSAYNQLKQLEQQRKTIELELQKAKSDYKTMVTNYEAGMVTIFNVNQLRLAILKNEIDLAKNAYTHANLYYAINHPDLLGKTK